jgi:alpha-amylase/alpha-mannosidase (GH57 family)
MAEVTIQFKDDFGCFMPIEEKHKIEEFLEKYQEEIPGLQDKFYVEDEEGLLILHTLKDYFLSTRDGDNFTRSIINLLSSISENSHNKPQFSLGGCALSKDFFKDLKGVCEEINFSATVEVVGQPGYYDVTYELADDGWNIPYCDYYEEDTDESW